MRAVQKRRLPERDAEVVVDCVLEMPRPGGERRAKLLQARALGRDAAAELRKARREIERPCSPKKIVRGPTGLYPEAFQGRIPGPHSHLMTRPFENLNQHAHRRIARRRRRQRIDQYHIDATKDAHSIEVALRLIEGFLLKKMIRTDGRHAPYRARIDVAETLNHD